MPFFSLACAALVALLFLPKLRHAAAVLLIIGAGPYACDPGTSRDGSAPGVNAGAPAWVQAACAFQVRAGDYPDQGSCLRLAKKEGVY